MSRVQPHLRRRGRTRAVQLLFALDMTRYAPDEEVLERFWALNPTRRPALEFAERIVRRVSEHRAEIDAILAEAAQNWRLDRIGYVERAILRMAVCELLYFEDTPPRVVIAEAIETCKQFPLDEAARFINGVLDRVLRNLQPKGDGGQPAAEDA